MKLIELLERLDEEAGKGVIYVEKNRPRDTDSAVLVMPEDHTPDKTARAHPDYEYLIEVFRLFRHFLGVFHWVKSPSVARSPWKH